MKLRVLQKLRLQGSGCIVSGSPTLTNRSLGVPTRGFFPRVTTRIYYYERKSFLGFQEIRL